MANYGPKPKPRGTLAPDDIPPWNCMRCKRTLPVREYHPHSGAAYGFSKKCKDCANRECREAAARRGPDYARNLKLQKNYGITLDDLNETLARQGGCGVCGTREHGGRFWHVDHDHACCPQAGRSCGKCVRGILCHTCNLMLGYAKDRTDVLAQAIEYLRRTGA